MEAERRSASPPHGILTGGSDNATSAAESLMGAAHPLEVAISASAVILILLSGTLANAASLAVTCRHGAQSKLHWIFVGNLALADLLLALLTPGTWYLYVWASTDPGCRAVVWTEAAVRAAQSASLSAVVIVTLDRASLVFRPIKYRLSHRKAMPLLLSACLWLVCIAVQIPKLATPERGRLIHQVNAAAEFAAALAVLAGCNFTICRRIDRSRKIKILRRHSGYSTTMAAVVVDGKGSAMVPLDTAAVGYRRSHLQQVLCRDARLSLQSIGRLSLDANSRRYARQRTSEEVINEILNRQHRRALRTLLLLVLLFAACRLPRTLLSIVDWAGVLTQDLYLRCNFYLELLVHINSLLDPFAYVLCGNRLCHSRTREFWRLFSQSCVRALRRILAAVGCCGCSDPRPQPCVSCHIDV